MRITILIIILLVLVLSVILWMYFLIPESSSLVISEKPPVIENKLKTHTLLFAGDIMLDRGVEWKIQQHDNDWKWPFLLISDMLNEADLVFGNLENPISDTGERVGSIYSFRANPQSIQGLTHAGFDVLSVSNNHSFDYGRIAFADSLTRLKEAGIGYAGGGFSSTEAHSPFISEVKGTKIGFLAYTSLGGAGWEGGEKRRHS